MRWDTKPSQRIRRTFAAPSDSLQRIPMPPESFSDYLDLALQEIDQYGAEVRQVQRRIDALLADLATVALPEHRVAVAEWQHRHRKSRQDVAAG